MRMSGLVELSGFWNNRQNMFTGQLFGVDPQFGQRLRQRRRVHRACGERPRLFDWTDRLVQQIGDHHSIDGLGWMARPPADNTRAQPLVHQNVPQGLDLTGGGQDGLHSLTVGGRLYKS